MYLQTLPPEFGLHTNMHAYDEGSGFQNQVEYVVRHGGTCPLDPHGFSLLVFSWIFFFNGDLYLLTGPSPPLEWTSFPPLVTEMLIEPKNAESSGSCRIGVTGALVNFLASETRLVQTCTFLSLPGLVAH